MNVLEGLKTLYEATGWWMLMEGSSGDDNNVWSTQD